MKITERGVVRVIECREIRFERVADPEVSEHARIAVTSDGLARDHSREFTLDIAEPDAAVQILPGKAETLFSWAVAAWGSHGRARARGGESDIDMTDGPTDDEGGESA